MQFCCRSLDADQHSLDMKRQMQVVEQEANVLRTRNQTLESENEKLMAENKRLQLTHVKKFPQDKMSSLETKVRIIELEKKLEEANKKVNLFLKCNFMLTHRINNYIRFTFKRKRAKVILEKSNSN